MLKLFSGVSRRPKCSMQIEQCQAGSVREQTFQIDQRVTSVLCKNCSGPTKCMTTRTPRADELWLLMLLELQKSCMHSWHKNMNRRAAS